MTQAKRAILTITCPDRPGLVAMFADFVLQQGGNIIESHHHRDEDASLFITRLEWSLAGFQLDHEQTLDAAAKLATKVNGEHQLFIGPKENRMAIWVSHQNHCLYDLLIRQQAGDFDCEIPVIISNHPELAQVANQFQIPFEHIPVLKGKKEEAEQRALEVCRHHRVNLIVLAKYMQILSSDFLTKAPMVINIHHSFLPAFPGSKPYHSAHNRGVKIIGATSHYVTEVLDAGPIIAQDVIRVDHSYSIADLVREGKDIERVVLARAVRQHLQHRVVVYNNKTAVF